MRYRLVIFISLAAFLNLAIFTSTCHAENCYASETAKEDSLDSYKLLATILESSAQNSFAVIKNIDSEQLGIYKIGNTILGYQVAKILRGQVVLLRNGKKFVLNFPLGGVIQPIIEVFPDQRIVNRAALDKKVPDLNTALKQAIPIPLIQSGKVVGIKVTNIKDKSLAKQAGIKDGDVIVSINNQNIDSMRNAMEILNVIRGQEKINLVVKRGTDIKNLIYYVN